MNKQFPRTLQYLLPVILLFSFAAAQAQSSGSDTTTHHPSGMHHSWGDRNGRGPDRNSRGFEGKGHGFDHNGRSFDGWANRGGQHIHYTPEQRQQAMAINKDYRQKTQDLFKQDNITLKQYKASLLALQKEKKDKLAALLTPQQKDEIAARRKNRDENMQVRAAAHLERLKLHLNLSDDQVAKLKAGQENLRNEFKAIHEADNLLPQQKMEQLKALMAKRNDTYKSVLTPDQYTQFEKMSHRRAAGGFRGSRAI
jgi:hypothetical protein